MASLPSPTTTILLLLLFLLHHGHGLSSPTASSAAQSHNSKPAERRNLALMEEDEEPPARKPPPKKKPISETKNQTKPIKPKKSNSTATTTTTTTTTTKIKLNKLNKTLNATSKTSNTTKLPKPIKPVKSNSTTTKLKSLNSTSNPPKSQKKTLDLSLPKNKTTPNPKPQQPTKPNVEKKKQTNPPPKKTDHSDPLLYSDDDADGGDDLITEFRDLPSRLLPDLERLSVTSKTYISRANREIAEGVKPYVGNKYASTIASIASAVFLVLPLLLLTLLFHHFRSYLSLQRVLISIQAYLAIYFATLALTALATGLEPLRFFYAASPSSYACTQALQTLGYVLYLLVQLIHLVVVFSSGGDGGDMGARALGLAQMMVGLAVGLHYYAVVFHRAVTGEPPRANWKVHGMYAVCFLVICALARAERRKKAYLPEGGDDGKKS